MSFVSFATPKTPFLPNNAKYRYFSLSFKLGHVTYQNIWLDPRVPNFHFPWVSNEFSDFRNQKKLFSPKNAKFRITGLGHFLWKRRFLVAKDTYFIWYQSKVKVRNPWLKQNILLGHMTQFEWQRKIQPFGIFLVNEISFLLLVTKKSAFFKSLVRQHF